MLNKPFRLHFSSVIENTLSAVLVIIVLIITNVIGIEEEINGIDNKEAILAILFLSAIMVAIFVVNFIRWRKTYITLDKDSIIIERKLLMLKKTTIGIKNIAAVNLEQNLLQRIFRTYKIKLDTNSLTTANETDVKIVLKKELALELQKRIVELLNEGQTVIEEKEAYDIEYDFEKVMLHSILSIPVFAIMYAVVVMVLFGFGLQTGELFVASIQGILSILIIIVPAVFTMIKAIFRLYNFKLKRVDDKICIKYGLITTKKYTIPIDKINAVVIRQPVLARIFRQYTVELINVGMGEIQQESPVLFLMGSKAEIIEKMKRILPEVRIDKETIPQSKKALVPICIKAVVWAVIASSIAILFMPYLTISIVAFAVLAVMLIYKTRRLGIYDEYIKIVNGIFERKFTIIKYTKLQYVALQQNLITEKLNIAKAQVYILAEMSKIRHDTGYFDKEQFEIIANRMLEKRD